MFQALKQKSLIVKSAVALVFVLLLVLVAMLLMDERTAPSISAPVIVEQIPALPAPLSNSDETALQQQLQGIIASKKEANCASLKDPRYQTACHDFFNVKK